MVNVGSARLRWGVPADAEHIANYHYQCWQQSFAPLVDPKVMELIEPRVAVWQERLDPSSELATVVAVDQDDQAIAHALVIDDELVHLFVDPAHHRLGLGRQLLAVAERQIARNGYDRAKLCTIVGNAPAIALYESCGWVVTDERKDENLPNGSSYTEHVLRKDLSLPNHVVANRATWTDDAPNWVERGRRSWAAQPHWGEMQLAEDELQLLTDLEGCDVVEIGCGTGYVSSWCLRAGATSVVGLDNSIAQLRTAKQLQSEFEQPFPLAWGNGESLPFADNSFDVAINEYGAALWCDPHRWVAEAARVLRPGGRIIFLTMSMQLTLCAPDFEHEHTSSQLMRAQRDLHRVEFPDTDGVEFALSHGDWIALLRWHGFGIERLVELYAPREGGPDRYSYYDASWARQWPAEEAWVATLR